MVTRHGHPSIVESVERFRVPVLKSLPTATVDWRGRMVMVYGDGANDRVYVCRHLSTGVYEWTAAEPRMAHGQIYVAAADSGAITISDTTSYFEATAVTWTFSSAVSHLFDESAGNGRLTYTGEADVVVHIACSLSFTTANNNRTMHVRLGISGTTDPGSEGQRRVSTATDVGSTAVHLIAAMSKGDYISMFVRNATSADNITVETANIQGVAMSA